MKQKLLLILILFASIMNAQEQKTMELNPPLNLKKCVQCVQENPTISLIDINQISGFASDYLINTKNNFIPITIITNNKGVIKEIKIEENFEYRKSDEINISGVNELLNKCIGKNLFNNISLSFNIKTTLCFYISNNQIVLNPIVH